MSTLCQESDCLCHSLSVRLLQSTVGSLQSEATRWRINTHSCYAWLQGRLLLLPACSRYGGQSQQSSWNPADRFNPDLPSADLQQVVVVAADSNEPAFFSSREGIVSNGQICLEEVVLARQQCLSLGATILAAIFTTSLSTLGWPG